MVGGNITGSSRRCNECKRKRKKCDLTEPSCLRCVRSGVRCSGLSDATLFVNHKKTSFTSQTSSSVLRHAHSTRTALTNKSRQFHDNSLSRVQGLRSAWIEQRTRSSLPGDQYLLSGNIAMPETLYAALSEEFRAGKTSHRGVFSADRAPNEATRHYSSVAICIRSLLDLDAFNVPVLGPAILSLLSLYYGRLHADTSLVELARSSYTIALSQYHQHIEAFMLTQTENAISKRNWLCASIVLQFFEHVDHVQVFDFEHKIHIDGAMRLLELCGPGILQGSLELEAMFGSVLAVVTFLGIHRRQSNFLSEPKWHKVLEKSDGASLREDLIQLSLEIPALLSSADKLLKTIHDDGDGTKFVDLSLHLLATFDHLQMQFTDWTSRLRVRTPGPLYWSSNQPTSFEVSPDDECAPKTMDNSHQIRFSYGTIAGLLVQLWAFQLELLMTSIDLRRATLQHCSSAHVQSIMSTSLQEEITAADEKARLILEAQIYLESCLEGFICLQLPLRSATRYFQRLA